MDSRLPQHISGVSSVMVPPLLDAHIPYGRLQHPLTIFPIDQMKSSHMQNDYIDSPAVVLQPAASQKPPIDPHKTPPGDSQLPRSHAHDVTHPWIAVTGRPDSISSSSSASSEQRLLDHGGAAPVEETSSGLLRNHNFQPKSLVSNSSDAKGAAAPPAGGAHTLLCEICGKCRCTDCTLPRTLPSCWVCNQECLCSAQSLVDCATCMCLVKGVFYHCADDGEDDEGSCAERPCSCTRSNCCARWAFMAGLSLVLPCLLCYLPAMGCAKLCQRCYDSACRPGCRCKTPQTRNGVKCKTGLLGIQSS